MTHVGQDIVTGKVPSIDDSLKTGFNFLAKGKYADARIQFEAAQTSFTRDPEPSQWLFTKIRLPDENEGDVTSQDPQIRQITGWRHSMGTQQAILMILAFTSQLQGDKVQAEKYKTETYKLQSPVWGLSWRMFIPPIEGLFHTTVPEDTSASYARYEFMAGELLYSAEEKKPALAMMKNAQELVPKDAEISASLAGYYLIEFEPASSRRYGEISVGIDPKQGRVYIDLGTACWLLGDLDAAIKYATMAQNLEPELPGPHGTLALALFEKGYAATAATEAQKGVKLSNRFPFYLTIQAIVFEGAGKGKDAEKIMKEAWKDERPDAERLKKWFFRDRSLDLALKVVSRLK